MGLVAVAFRRPHTVCPTATPAAGRTAVLTGVGALGVGSGVSPAASCGTGRWRRFMGTDDARARRGAKASRRCRLPVRLSALRRLAPPSSPQLLATDAARMARAPARLENMLVHAHAHAYAQNLHVARGSACRQLQIYDAARGGQRRRCSPDRSRRGVAYVSSSCFLAHLVAGRSLMRGLHVAPALSACTTSPSCSGATSVNRASPRRSETPE